MPIAKNWKPSQFDSLLHIYFKIVRLTDSYLHIVLNRRINALAIEA